MECYKGKAKAIHLSMSATRGKYDIICQNHNALFIIIYFADLGHFF